MKLSKYVEAEEETGLEISEYLRDVLDVEFEVGHNELDFRFW